MARVIPSSVVLKVTSNGVLGAYAATAIASGSNLGPCYPLDPVIYAGKVEIPLDGFFLNTTASANCVIQDGTYGGQRSFNLVANKSIAAGEQLIGNSIDYNP